uniref:RING-type domain-containing protein n=1 Tax=Chromera velia CCMP2878 TaxID=1169474 RepID=A0A0G4GFY8_9ALVE|mmetsp:Transcript_20334/g.40706  ORF Transcript_20334/g.40706 Transcript_20334/m.40706 type:complete len:814 (-) Transcript_20334:246-2687(-)|eukprot:Cvel_4661.t1-p1 / transcript=Cvel_4661.t1 / gene=Cvel_4661 / organism=Chromera_velia_CCMP2878 / gene_product=Ras guanine nucleotide exchange factor F, putative / transcript_product=Ras guanine nucleotide exchange factor F, putative / location=Cvel_scaffold205:106758-114939(+) / protein_length=813 / sequence_SO=supercontig / SO=protein_coding / is_pseudo=false
MAANTVVLAANSSNVSSRHTRVWEEVQGLDSVYSSRTGHAAASWGRQIFVFGGTDGASRKNDLHVLDTRSGAGREVVAEEGAPPARSGAQAVAYNGSVYIFGGYTKKDGEYFNDVWCFEPARNRWRLLQTAGEAAPKRTDHSCTVAGGLMFVFGGSDGRQRFDDLRTLNLQVTPQRWMECKSSRHPSGRFGHSAVIWENSMYVFGGWDGHDTLAELWEYMIPTNTWTKLDGRGNLPQSRYRHSAVAICGSVFIFGGVDKGQNRFRDLFEFDCTSLTWMEVITQGHPPTARTFHRAVTCDDGRMYILGGFDGRRRADLHRIDLSRGEMIGNVPNGQDIRPSSARVPSAPPRVANGIAPSASAAAAAAPAAAAAAVLANRAEAESLTPEDMWKWSQVVPKNEENVYSARTGHAVVVWSDSFFLFGGTDEQARQNDIYEYSVSNNYWCPVTANGSPPASRSGCKAVVYRESVFFFGGYTKKEGNYFNDLHAFHIPSKTWTAVQPVNKPAPARTDHSCVVSDGKMMVFGGWDGKTRFNDVQEFDLERKVWREIAIEGPSTSQPAGRFGHTAVVYKQSMYVFGGWNGNDTLVDLYEFGHVSEQWFHVTARGDIPKARYRHSAVVHGCCMFIFGGVDKRQERFNDLYEFSFDTRCWTKIHIHGASIPSARTFHRAVLFGGFMYILGGFDGKRQNDMWKIALAESVPREDKGRKLRGGKGAGDLALRDPEEDAEAAAGNLSEAEASLVGRLRAQIHELQRRLEREEERHVCKICYEQEIDTVFLGCYHRVSCHKCSKSITDCPVCRRPVGQEHVIQTITS